MAAKPVAAPSVNSPADTGFAVHLARRGMTITVGGGETLLDALQAAGVNWTGTCLEGRCSNCLCRVISGTIDHRDSVLTEKERTRGDRIITCVSRGRPDGVLVLDL